MTQVKLLMISDNYGEIFKTKVTVEHSETKHVIFILIIY